MESWLENFARANFQRSADTAHDLKTPLNVAVLNLELLRMHLRKVAGEDDEKSSEYMRAIETELRRMGHIFDAFFLLSAPPRNDEPTTLDLAAICAEEAAAHGFELAPGQAAFVLAHESRIRQGCKLFFEGTARLFPDSGRSVEASTDGANYVVAVMGRPLLNEPELTKIFKFYYTDPEGNPDLSLATARLIAETYGGALGAAEDLDRDNVTVRLSFPLGAR